MHEFAYFSIGGLPTKSGSTASAASQYSLRDLHMNIMLNPHAATQVRMSSYERQAGSNPKVRVADQPRTVLVGEHMVSRGTRFRAQAEPSNALSDTMCADEAAANQKQL